MVPYYNQKPLKLSVDGEKDIIGDESVKTWFGFRNCTDCDGKECRTCRKHQYH